MLLKVLSIYVVILLFTAALIVGTYDLLTGHDVPAVALAVVSAAMGIAVNQLGIHQGLVLTNSNTAEAVKALSAHYLKEKAAQLVPPNE